MIKRLRDRINRINKVDKVNKIIRYKNIKKFFYSIYCYK